MLLPPWTPHTHAHRAHTHTHTYRRTSRCSRHAQPLPRPLQQDVHWRPQLGDDRRLVEQNKQQLPFFFVSFLLRRFRASDGLRNYFTQFGDIDQCTIMRDPTGRSRGFAFLTFKDPASVTKVLSQDHQLDGKMVSARVTQRPTPYSNTYVRSTPSAPSPAPSTSAPPRSSSAVSRPPSPPRRSRSS